jgi:hypothetical protein
MRTVFHSAMTVFSYTTAGRWLGVSGENGTVGRLCDSRARPHRVWPVVPTRCLQALR